VKLPHHMIILCLTFWRNNHSVFHRLCTILHFLQSKDSNSLTLLFYFSLLFNYSHSNSCEVVSHFIFICYVCDDYLYLTYFPLLIIHLYTFFGEMSSQVFFPCFNCIVSFCCLVIGFIPYDRS
jgi:hypothetical protein